VRRKTPPPPAAESETTARLLDTAERLFAEHGYDGVGMRALAEEAGVNLGATTYHYGSKERLYLETFMRRFRPANQARLEALRRAEAGAAAGRALPVETIVDCLLRAPFMTVLAHPNFPALLARNLFMPPPFLKEVLRREHDPVMAQFAAALARALPALPPEVLQMRMMFAGGALLMFAGHMGRLPLRGNPALCEFALNALVRFIAGGLRAESAAYGADLPRLPLPFLKPRA
jgi:AcrR family transcriptional regulator